MCILITGVAGFIGAALASDLIKRGEKVVGIDNLNNYYDVNLKKSRIKNIKKTLNKSSGSLQFEKCKIEDKNALKIIFSKYRPKVVVNLAAQAGVRYSTINPSAYFESNLLGFGNILEECRKHNIQNLVYASSSSVYGGNKQYPYNEDQLVGHPVSLYAATKRANELMAHSYSHIYNLPTTGIRFFTVYGPWGRPDMAPMIFTKSIFENQPINIFNYGKMIRDFTYIDDVVEGLMRCCYKPATIFPYKNSNILSPSISFAPYRIFNLGNSKPIKLMDFINTLEKIIGLKALKNFVEMSSMDVQITESDTSKLNDWIDFKPKTELEYGLRKFISWYKKYYEYK